MRVFIVDDVIFGGYEPEFTNNSSIYGSIYLYRCLDNGKFYVGQTLSGPAHRRNQHKHLAKHGSKLVIHQALRKYGDGSFAFYVIYVVLSTGAEAHDQLHLDSAERQLIATFDSINSGYNRKEGGSKGRHAESTKKKISEANGPQLREWAASRKGVKRPSEVGEKIRIAKLGKPTILRGVPKAPDHAAELRAVCLRNAENMRGKPGATKGRPNPLKGKPAHPNSVAALLRNPRTHTRNTRWVTNGIRNKRIKAEESIPNRWYYGRVSRLKGRVFLYD